MTRTLAAALASLLVLALCATSAAAGDAWIIKAGTLIDGSGGEPVRRVSILVKDGRIAAMGRGVTAPPDAEVVDLSRRWVLPGFIDAHVHLAGRHIGEGEWKNDAVRDLPQEDAIRGVRNARLTLEAGFTTVRNVGAHHYSDIALRDAIEDGVVPGPRMLTGGHSLGITGGHCDTNGFNPGVMDRGPEDGIADGVERVMRAVRTQIKRGADVIKFCATGGVLSEGDPVGVQQYTFEEMKALVEVAHLGERKVAAHAHGNQGIKTALRAGVDSVEHGSILDDEALELFKETGAFLVPTLMAQEAVERQANEGVLEGLRREKALFIAPKARASFRRAVEAGVKVALGSDAGVFPHGTNGREFVLMVRNGMEPMDALMAGTRHAAVLLGVADQVGTLETGKVADIVALAADPLEQIETVTEPVFVMNDGEVVVWKD